MLAGCITIDPGLFGQIGMAESTAAPGKAGDTTTVSSNGGGTGKAVEFIRGRNEKDYSAAELYQNSVNSVVGIRSEGKTRNIFGQTSLTASSGTGIILTEDGYILTNNHVVEKGTKFSVDLFNGETYEATVVGAEKNNDVAVLKIDAKGLKPAAFGDSDAIMVGQDVAVIGNPLGELTYTMTRGIVSALNRALSNDGAPITVFQIDAAVNEGNSGGPCFDASGNVIGVVTAKINSDMVEGIGFCIPANDALNIAGQLIEFGYIKGKAALSASVATAYRNSFWGSVIVSGAYVEYVIPGGAADKAGITPGILITSVNSTAITSPEDLETVLRARKAGSTVTIKGNDGSSEYEYQVTLDEYTPDVKLPEGVEIKGTMV
ncbi:MAG: trypsin-like peptidase domain-containing protein [Clostridia bacterium]|nr:trypsin-like peptidase domain-containing protein [Clostridia bacterium]